MHTANSTHTNAQRIERRELRDYQKTAVEESLATLEDHDRAHLVMACGTGKTLTTAAILDKMTSAGDSFTPDTSLILVPSLALAAQTWSELSKTLLGEFAIFGSSGPGESGVEGAPDALVTTDPSELLDWHRRRSGRRIVISTYHSAPKLIEAQKGAWLESGGGGVSHHKLPEFSMMIADEAHKVSGKREDSDWSVSLGEALKVRKRLFATATPTTGSGTSMRNESLFGPRSFTFTFGEAIQQGRLSHFHLAAVGVKEGGSGNWGYEQEDMGGVADAILTAARDYNLSRVAVFCASIKEARAVASLIRSSGKGSADYLEGKHTWEQRQQKLARLARADRLHVLASVNTISEGVDVPTLDAVVFAAPKSSAIQVVQIVGRAIRLNPQRSEPSLVIAPVYIPDGEDGDDLLSEAKFDTVLKVVRGLWEHDPEYIQRITPPRRNRERVSDGSSPEEDDPISVIDDTGSIDLDAFYARLVEDSKNIDPIMRFTDRVLEIRDFIKERGRWPSSTSKDVQEGRLARWLTERKNAGSEASGTRIILSAQQVEILNTYLPGWELDPLEREFERKLWSLKDFIDYHRRFPSTSTPNPAPNEAKLARFLYIHSTGDETKKPRLKARRQRLDEVIPFWRDQRSWFTFLDFAEEAGRFIAENQRRPRCYGDESPLGNFIKRQRKRWERGDYPEYRAKVMDIHVPGWREKPNPALDRHAATMREVEARTGGLPRVSSPNPDERRAAIWLRDQRRKLGEGSLGQTVRDTLDDIHPGWRYDQRLVNDAS